MPATAQPLRQQTCTWSNSRDRDERNGLGMSRSRCNCLFERSPSLTMRRGVEFAPPSLQRWSDCYFSSLAPSRSPLFGAPSSPCLTREGETARTGAHCVGCLRCPNVRRQRSYLRPAVKHLHSQLLDPSVVDLFHCPAVFVKRFIARTQKANLESASAPQKRISLSSQVRFRASDAPLMPSGPTKDSLATICTYRTSPAMYFDL